MIFIENPKNNLKDFRFLKFLLKIFIKNKKEAIYFRLFAYNKVRKTELRYIHWFIASTSEANPFNHSLLEWKMTGSRLSIVLFVPTKAHVIAVYFRSNTCPSNGLMVSNGHYKNC